MNIFAVHINPSVCVRILDDKRVNKMILESLQMLSTCARLSQFPDKDRVMRTSFVNHPCTVWTRASQGNYKWLLSYAELLSDEADFRGFNTSSYRPYFFPLKDALEFITPGDRTEFADCTEFKTRRDLDVTERYQMFMTLKWLTRDRFPSWKHRKTPWFVPWCWDEIKKGSS